MTSDLHVTIAVLTYRRPDHLAAVLPALDAQIGRVQGLVTAARLLVVDNSPDAEAKALVESFARTTAQFAEVAYENETRPGIPAARNRALEASSGSDLLVFIDDDERPSDHWLAPLLHTFAHFDAVAVAGAVVPEYSVPPPRWIEAGQFFRRRRAITGTPLSVAATNNLLIDLRITRATGLTFDVGLSFGGGDDSLFTRQLARYGQLVWCDEAVVVDNVPAHRITRDWVLRRALSSGNSAAVVSVRLADSRSGRAHARLVSVGAGLLRVMGGAARMLVGTCSRRADLQARGARTLVRGVGMLLGAGGLSYKEYLRADAGHRRLVVDRR